MRNRTYRALAGVNAAEKAPKGTLGERADFYWGRIEQTLRHWNSNKPVDPYPDYFTDADAEYRKLLLAPEKTMETYGISDIDNPYEVLNAWGSTNGHVFLSTPPKEWRADDTRRPGEMTGLLSYSQSNPDGMFEAYHYPIEIAFNNISADSCRLVHNGTGAMHDCLQVSDIDWSATFLPEIGFCHHVAIGRQPNGELMEYSMIETDDAHAMKDFFVRSIGNSGWVAMIECRC